MILGETEGINPMIKQRILAIAALSTLLCGAASATESTASAGEASYTIEVRGYVPVICRAQVSATLTPAQAGTVDLGQLNEFCNNPTGYEVWVDYPPSLSGASVTIDGQTVALSDSGSTRIDQSTTAGIASKSLALNLADNQSGSLSIRVVAL
jgi:hypothetical protein